MSKADAEVVQLLRDHGLILIGEASMTQFLGVEGTNATVGWSPLSGQTQSAFVAGGVRDDLVFGHSLQEDPPPDLVYLCRLDSAP